jgi:hypothetical protein
MSNANARSQSTSLRQSRPQNQDLNLNFGETVYKFVLAAATGKTETGQVAREVACFGTRGDGKTQGALGAMVAHAQLHQQAGFQLPTKWIGVTDTFASHKNKTVESLNNQLWQGLWRLKDGGHIATFGKDGYELVNLHLFGIEDQGAMDRVRTETVGVWFEEPAPTSLLVQSSGVDSGAWGMAITSQRIPSHCHPAIMTLNYPDEDHWTWQRFIAQPAENTAYYRVPPGERASAAQRAEWMTALKDRPDLQRRLLEGKPGTVMLGTQVAQGFDEDKHVSRQRLEVIESEPLFFGVDFGHTPTVIIGQSWRSTIRVLAALTCKRGGIKQHLEDSVIPWLRVRAAYVLDPRVGRHYIHGQYDPSAPDSQDDIDQNPIKTIEATIPGYWYPGPVDWEARKNPLLTAMNRQLVLDPVDAKGLIQALSGRWYYPQDRLGGVSKDQPKKPNHPWEDYGDAFCYFLCGVMPDMAEKLIIRKPVKVVTDYRVLSR